MAFLGSRSERRDRREIAHVRKELSDGSRYILKLKVQHDFHSEWEDNERRTRNRSPALGHAPDGDDEMLRPHLCEVPGSLITQGNVRAGDDDGPTGEVD
jgi:hypothetical protein